MVKGQPLRGASLMEIVVSCTLLAILLPLLFNLFPSSLRALRRSSVMQTEASIAAYRMDEAAVVPRTAGVQDLATNVTVGGRMYSITRKYVAVSNSVGVDAYRLDAEVTVQTVNYVPYTVQSRFPISTQ